MKCSNCNKELKPGEREYCQKNNTTECAECTFHAMNGTRTIEKYNEWLKRAPVAINYQYTPGVGHYKDCPVCIGECTCP